MASRTILLTGATRGLGRALVDRFVEAGHTVLGCGRSSEHVAELSRRFPNPHQFTAVDVADDAEVAAWAKSVLNRGRAPDLLVNNAAVMNRPAPLWEIRADEFQSLIDVNLAGVVNVIRHFVPAMITRQTGIIVNLSSGWGRSTAPEVAPYCATKWAIEGLTQALAQELPDGLAAVAFNPGIINTDMLQTCWADGANRYPTADQWSHAAAEFLLSLGCEHNGKALTAPR
ncbi:MAG: SDR family oxidoreductase [Planctomycetaceae bacterium]